MRPWQLIQEHERHWYQSTGRGSSRGGRNPHVANSGYMASWFLRTLHIWQSWFFKILTSYDGERVVTGKWSAILPNRDSRNKRKIVRCPDLGIAKSKEHNPDMMHRMKNQDAWCCTEWRIKPSFEAKKWHDSALCRVILATNFVIILGWRHAQLFRNFSFWLWFSIPSKWTMQPRWASSFWVCTFTTPGSTIRLQISRTRFFPNVNVFRCFWRLTNCGRKAHLGQMFYGPDSHWFQKLRKSSDLL